MAGHTRIQVYIQIGVGMYTEGSEDRDGAGKGGLENKTSKGRVEKLKKISSWGEMNDKRTSGERTSLVNGVL